MIWQNKRDKQSKEIIFIKNTILSIVENLKIDIDVTFGNVLNSGFLVDKNTGKYLLIIEEKSMKDKDTSLDYKMVFKLIDFFHECKHYLQYTQNTIPEIEISIELGNACNQFKDAKYNMLPQELEAELYGIIKSKEYVTKNFPDIDYEKHLLEYVNNAEKWYGPISLKDNRVIFESYDQVIKYLIESMEIAYEYPVEFYYNKFPNQLDSSILANMKSGSEQQYVLAKELFREGKINANVVEKTETLFKFYSDKKRESIEDIYLDIPKENEYKYQIDDTLLSTIDKDKPKEEFDYEDE